MSYDGFVPPSPDEQFPTPPPDSATDYGLGGVEVSIEEMDEEEAEFVQRLTTASTVVLPTWAKFVAFLRSLVSKFPPGRKKENVNDYTHWYYGNWNVAASWCFIIISWVLDKFGMLDQIGGKRAWVPDLRKVRGHKSGASGLEAGHLVAVNDYNHIGICVYRSGSTFHLWSGNSTTTGSTDGTTVKSYSTSIVSGHVPLKFAPAAPPPAPAAKLPIPSPKLDVDGEVGTETYKALQAVLAFRLGEALYLNGKLDTATKKALQRYLKVTVDGDIGPKTVRALQKKVGVSQDGDWGPVTTRALQRRLNGGTF